MSVENKIILNKNINFMNVLHCSGMPKTSSGYYNNISDSFHKMIESEKKQYFSKIFTINTKFSISVLYNQSINGEIINKGDVVNKDNPNIIFMGHSSSIEYKELIENMNAKIDTLTDELTSFCGKLDNYFTNKNNYSEEEKNTKKIEIRNLIHSNHVNSLDYFAMKYLNEISSNYSNIYDYFCLINSEIKKCPECNHLKYKFGHSLMHHLTLPELNEETIKSSDVYLKLFEKKKEELKDKIVNEDLISKLCINQIINEQSYNLDELLIQNQIPEVLDENNLLNCNNCLKKVRAITQ